MEPKIVGVGAIAPMLKLTTKPFTKAMKLTEDARPKLMAALAAPSTDAEPSAVLLRVEGIKPPKDAALTFEVFLMKKGEKPSKKSYVGPISFFGRRGGHGHGEKDGFTQGSMSRPWSRSSARPTRTSCLSWRCRSSPIVRPG